MRPAARTGNIFNLRESKEQRAKVYRVQKQTAIIFTVALLVALVAACKGDSKGTAQGDSSVAATVNGRPLTLKEVDAAIKQQAGAEFSKLSPTQLAAARIQSLDSLIQQEVLFQRAEGEKLLPTDEEITRAINTQKQQANLTEEEYQKMLKDGGQTEQSVRDLARKQLAIQKLIEKTVGNVTIKDNEVVDFYNTNKAQFVTPRGVMLSAIIIDPTDSGGAIIDDAKNEFEAQNKINDIAAAIKRGEDFATLARNRSEDQSMVRSGDLGFATEEQLRQNRFPQEIISNLMGPMKPGDVTNPVRLDDGRFYIFKLTDKRLTTENQTLDTPGVRDKIKELLRNERSRIMGEAMRIVAMNDAKIVNNLAADILKDPSMLGGLTPAQPSQTAAPASTPAATSNTAAPAANAAASPSR